MTTSLRITIITVLLMTLLIAWQASVAHLYNPTVRTPVPAPQSTYTPTASEIAIRFYTFGH